MGVFGMARVTIEFKDKLPKDFETVENLTQALEKEHKGSYFSINDYEVGDNSVEFEVSSERVQNMDFQVNAIHGFCKTHDYEFLEFNSSGYEECDWGSLYDCGD